MTDNIISTDERDADDVIIPNWRDADARLHNVLDNLQQLNLKHIRSNNILNIV